MLHQVCEAVKGLRATHRVTSTLRSTKSGHLQSLSPSLDPPALDQRLADLPQHPRCGHRWVPQEDAFFTAGCLTSHMTLMWVTLRGEPGPALGWSLSTDSTKSPGWLRLSRTRNVQGSPLACSSVSACPPDMWPWYHLEKAAAGKVSPGPRGRH